MKVVKSLKNRGILLKGTSRKSTSQEGGFLNFLRPLAKRVLLPFVLTALISASDAIIQNKIYVSGTTTLFFSNEDLHDIMKVVKSLEKSRLLMKGVSETVENEAKKEEGGFLGIFSGILGARL